MCLTHATEQRGRGVSSMLKLCFYNVYVESDPGIRQGYALTSPMIMLPLIVRVLQNFMVDVAFRTVEIHPKNKDNKDLKVFRNFIYNPPS